MTTILENDDVGYVMSVKESENDYYQVMGSINLSGALSSLNPALSYNSTDSSPRIIIDPTEVNKGVTILGDSIGMLSLEDNLATLKHQTMLLEECERLAFSSTHVFCAYGLNLLKIDKNSWTVDESFQISEGGLPHSLKIIDLEFTNQNTKWTYVMMFTEDLVWKSSLMVEIEEFGQGHLAASLPNVLWMLGLKTACSDENLCFTQEPETSQKIDFTLPIVEEASFSDVPVFALTLTNQGPLVSYGKHLLQFSPKGTLKWQRDIVFDNNDERIKCSAADVSIPHKSLLFVAINCKNLENDTRALLLALKPSGSSNVNPYLSTSPPDHITHFQSTTLNSLTSSLAPPTLSIQLDPIKPHDFPLKSTLLTSTPSKIPLKETQIVSNAHWPTVFRARKDHFYSLKTSILGFESEECRVFCLKNGGNFVEITEESGEKVEWRFNMERWEYEEHRIWFKVRCYGIWQDGVGVPVEKRGAMEGWILPLVVGGCAFLVILVVLCGLTWVRKQKSMRGRRFYRDDADVQEIPLV
eukprot:CAMPEP_0115018172 /NCGR_PEP_ID=MMETSP0216-20121206/28616_1 /TAXON_ID=223996 /ORGANISM="Protocruzia adherens, Strain Boccale" /LENGTH=525 /DNA_ID=CAMNT_0002389253 /DNA_START=177 /DNA_END=1750 /DNA_ORIENTATION=-